MVRVNRKLSKGAIIVLGLALSPTIVAHADEGVITENFSVQDKNGKTIKEFKVNETIQIKSETPKTYSLLINDQDIYVEKNKVLKTIKYVEESLKIDKEETTIKSSPNYFGNVIMPIDKEEVVYRVQDVKEQNGFIKVRTSQAVEGWILKTSVKQNFKKEPFHTVAYMNTDELNQQGLSYGDKVTVIGFSNNQYQILDSQKEIPVGFSSISLTQPTRIIQEASSERATTHNQSLAESVIDKAREYLGVPYVWGGKTPSGFDCSGFTQYVLGSKGITIPRVASDQARVGKNVERANLQKGDMIFFETYKSGPSHVGFYIDNGNFIHAGGDRVQISNLSSPYYSQRYLWAKRMF